MSTRVDVTGLRIEGVFWMGDGGTFASVDLPGTHIGRDVTINGVKIHGTLQLDDVDVEGSLHIANSEIFARISLQKAKVKRPLDLVNTRVLCCLAMTDMDVGDSLYAR